jgi:hypothetical protein
VIDADHQQANRALLVRTPAGPFLALPTVMLIHLESSEAPVLREILASALKQLRIESARTDTHDFREAVHARERIVEAILEKLADNRVGIGA